MPTLFRRTIHGEYTERTDNIATKPTCSAKSYEIIPMFGILKGFGQSDTDPIGSVLYVAEDRSLSLGIFSPQTDAV
jgi:hypothetical protein